MFNRKEYMKKYRQRNKEKIKEYRQKNKEKLRKQGNEWKERNKERWKEYGRLYCLDNLEKIKEYKKKWAKNNPDKMKESSRRYRENKPEPKYNLEYKRQCYKKWRETEKGKAIRQRNQFKRKAIMKDTINTLTSQEWLDILEAYNYRCAYCDVEFEVENMPTRDHIIPISKSGHNTKENIIPACQSCNSIKGTKIIKELES